MPLTFEKYKIHIERIESYKGTTKEYVKSSDTGNPRDNGPVYEWVDKEINAIRETEILKMESRNENLDINSVIAAILGVEYTPSPFVMKKCEDNI